MGVSVNAQKWKTDREIDFNNDGDVIKASPGVLWGFELVTTDADTPIFVKFYDQTTAPNPAADTPKLVFGASSTSAAGTPPDVSSLGRAFAGGIEFTTGIAWLCTTGIADADDNDAGTVTIGTAYYN